MSNSLNIHYNYCLSCLPICLLLVKKGFGNRSNYVRYAVFLYKWLIQPSLYCTFSVNLWNYQYAVNMLGFTFLLTFFASVIFILVRQLIRFWGETLDRSTKLSHWVLEVQTLICATVFYHYSMLRLVGNIICGNRQVVPQKYLKS